jgi:hypothetical protein
VLLDGSTDPSFVSSTHNVRHPDALDAGWVTGDCRLRGQLCKGGCGLAKMWDRLREW